MNPDFPPSPPADSEARLTAFLLGELPPDATAEVQRELAQDPELARLHARLAQTIEFVREAIRQPAAHAEAGVARPRLSSERREALLAAFKTLRPFPPRARWAGIWRGRRRMVLALAASVVVLLAAGFVLVRRTAQRAETELAAVRSANEANQLFELQVPALDPSGQPIVMDASGRPVVLAGESGARRGRVRVDDGLAAAGQTVTLRRSPAPAAATASEAQPGLPGMQGGTAPAMDSRLMMRYGLAPQAPARSMDGAAWADYSNDALQAAPRDGARGAVAAGVSGAAPSAGAFVKAKLEDKAAPANVLGNWFAIVTNRAAEPDVVKETLGYAGNNNTLYRSGDLGGLAAAGGAGGGMGGFGGGGVAGGAPGLAVVAPGDRAPAGGATAWGYGARPQPQAGRSASEPVDRNEAHGAETAQAGGARRAAGQPSPAAIRATPPAAVPRPALAANGTELGRGNGPQESPPGHADGRSLSRLTSAATGATAPEAAGVPMLGDVPLLGRAFRPTGPRGETAARGEGLAQRSDESSRAGGHPLAQGIEAAKQVEELEPLPLKLPVPAFMGTPTDIPLETRPSVAESKANADFNGDTQADLFANGPIAVTGSKLAAAARPEAAAQPAPRAPGIIVAGKPSEPPTQNLYFRDLAEGGEARERGGLALNQIVERYGDAVLSKGLPALRQEPALSEALSRTATPASTARTGEAADELRRKLSSVADAKDSNRQVEAEVADKELAVERLAEVKQRADAKDHALEARLVAAEPEGPATRPAPPPPVPQPETATAENNFSTFSLNVADVSFKLAAASLDNGNLPEPASIRVEEFVNAFDYRDPAPVADAPVSFAWERAQYPFAHNREVLRFAVRTAAQGRELGRPLNLVLLLDNSGSMERADRVSIIREALQVLGNQLQAQDQISVVAFARNARLWVDALPGNQAADLPARVGNLTPEGGTNLEEALRTAYETARRHFRSDGVNRVILLTDGAANLGDVSPDSLKQMVEEQRRRGVALDCFGIGWEGYNDDLLEVLTRNGDGRYGFVNTADDAATGFANQLAGALQVAAADVKAQVEFNPARVTNWRQIGYAKHQLTQEQFRDNAVDAAEIAAAEAGNALYVVEVNPQGQGPLGVMRVRYRVPTTGQYHEHAWALEYDGPAAPQGRASASMRLATTAAAFGEMLSGSPYAAEVNSGALLALLADAPRAFDPDPRPAQLGNMLRQAQSIGGR